MSTYINLRIAVIYVCMQLKVACKAENAQFGRWRMDVYMHACCMVQYTCRDLIHGRASAMHTVQFGLPNLYMLYIGPRACSV